MTNSSAAPGYLKFPRTIAHDVKWFFHVTLDMWQDRRLGIDTSGQIEPTELQSAGPNARLSYVYRATPHAVLSLAFWFLNVDPSRFTFIDFGSGKGRVVARAARYRFITAIGVEFSRLLHPIALRNLSHAHAKGSLRAPTRLYNEDVTQFALPTSPLVLFNFNSFQRPVLRKLLRNLDESFRVLPRDCYFIYLNPKDGDCIEELSALREVPFSTLSKLIIRVLSPWPLKIYRIVA